jgi:rsbT co-antagonist protein RsbR
MSTLKTTDETSPGFRALLDALPDPVVLLDRGGVILASNGAWKELAAEASSGAVAPSSEGKGPWLDQLAAMFPGAAEDHDAIAAGLRAVVAGEEPRFDRDHLYTQAGEARCLSVTLSPLGADVSAREAGDRRDAAFVLVQARRATEPLLRRNAEAELRKVVERSERFMIATTEGVCLIDRGRIIDANPAAIRLLGRTKEEVLGLNVMELAPPEDKEEVLRRLRENVGGVYEAKLIRGDGSWFYAELSASAVPYEGRTIRGTAVRDVTQRRLAEIALRESEERFRLLSEITSEGVVLTEGGLVVDINPAACELLGFARDELVGQSLVKAIDPAFHDRFRESVAGNRSDGYESVAIHKDGSKIPVRVKGRILPFLGRTIRGSTIRDLRLERQIEEALRQKVTQEAELAAQAAALAELSTPLIPISDHVVVMPLIGAIDHQRAERVVEALLGGVASASARVAILDITGVPAVDSEIADALIRAARAVRLIGAEVVLTGIRPEVAQTLVAIGADLSGIPTRGTLWSGITYAMTRRGGG